MSFEFPGIQAQSEVEAVSGSFQSRRERREIKSQLKIASIIICQLLNAITSQTLEILQEEIVSSPKNAKLFSLQIPWNEGCIVLLHGCLLIFQCI